jgi:hypothetical protein
MTMNVMETVRKMMGWYPNANAFASKRVMLALPVDEEFQPGEKGKDIQNFGKMGWANIYRNFVLLLTFVGIVGFVALFFAMNYLLEGRFQVGIIAKGILTGMIYAVFSITYTWKKLNQIIDQNEIKVSYMLLLKSFVFNAIIMATILFLSFTIGKENPLLFMISIFFPSILINYPLVVYWEQKNRKTIYLVEEKFLKWRPVALPSQSQKDDKK